MWNIYSKSSKFCVHLLASNQWFFSENCRDEKRSRGPATFIFAHQEPVQETEEHQDFSYIIEHELMLTADEGLTLETLALETLYGGQFTLTTQLMKTNYLKLPHTDASITVSIETPSLYS